MAGGLRVSGFFPGAVEMIVRSHAAYYGERWGFDISFEEQVRAELTEFAERLEAGRDLLLVAMDGDRFAGSVAIDGSCAVERGVRLRWYIVEPEYRARGVGKRLLADALEFCDGAGFETVYLWTFRGLDRARALYESAGFHLVEERDAEQWGGVIPEQLFERKRNG